LCERQSGQSSTALVRAGVSSLLVATAIQVTLAL
jgi:hypothetical protein